MAGVGILIATDIASDAEPVQQILSEEFEAVSISGSPDTAVADFERCNPAVLILAFQELKKAESYYLGLYRLSTKIHVHPHHTLILCRKEEVREVYELCRRDHFNEFILYWPLPYDARYRLLMGVHSALRRLAANDPSVPCAAEFAGQARRIAELESVLERSVAEGGEQIGTVSRSLEQAQSGIGAAIDEFSHKLVEGGLSDLVDVKDGAGLQREFDEVKVSQIDRRLQAVTSALGPVGRWVKHLRRDVEPHLESARALRALSDQVRPIVLVVDDDPFMCQTAGRMLEAEGLQPVYAENGVGAFKALRTHRPALVLMDFNMPGLDGISVTRALKSVPPLASVPVIMMTGEGGKETVVACRRAGAADFLLKPFERETFLRKVRRTLAGRDSAAEAPAAGYQGNLDEARVTAFIEQLGQRVGGG